MAPYRNVADNESRSDIAAINKKGFKDETNLHDTDLTWQILSSDKNQFCVMISLVASVGTGCSIEQKILKTLVMKVFMGL